MDDGHGSRRLLLVSQRPLEYGGGGSVRWRFLRDELPRHGWTVDAVTARPNPTANDTSADPREARLSAMRASVMGVAGRMLAPAARRAGVQPEALALNNLWGLTGRGAVRAAIQRVRPHVVVATCPPPAALIAAAAVAPVAGVPLIAEMRDLWAGNPFFDAGGAVLPRVEARAFARCAAVVSVTDGCRDRLLSVHPDVEPRFELLPNGFDPSLLAMRGAAPAPAPGTRPATLIHAGSLYGDRSAVALIRAARRPELRERVRLELVGAVDPATVGEAAAGAATPEVQISRPIGWAEAVERTRAADIAVVINSPGTGGDMALPSKLFEALALGKPVLALTQPSGDTDRLLRDLGQEAGCAPPDDEAAIAAAITRLLDAPPPPVDPARLEPWNRAAVAARYAALLDRVAGAAVPATG